MTKWRAPQILFTKNLFCSKWLKSYCIESCKCILMLVAVLSQTIPSPA